MASNRILVAARPTLVVPAQAGPLVSDSFDRANSTTTLGAADTGQTWTAISGTLGINTNKAYVPGGSGVAHLDSGVSDVDLTVDITHNTGNDAGVIFRSLDADNYMMARLGANKVELYRKQANTWNLVADVAMTLTAGQVYAFRVVASGSTIDVYVDGVKKMTATDGFQSTLTKHGLYGNDGNARWDNFKVEAAPLLVTDSFDRADSATSLGTADTGQVWSALAGTWGIETNRAYSPETTPADRQAAVESGAADVKVAVDLAAVGVGCGLLFRCVDANNYWIFVEDGVVWKLWKRVAGTHTAVGELSEAPFAGRMEVVCSGSTITCKVDGVTKITATDTAHQTATRHGLRDHENGSLSAARFDNFQVEAA